MMKRMLVLLGTITVLGLAANADAAGDPQAGKARVGACAGCHGANGEGKDKNPPLAGKSESEIVQALQDYKSGKRVSPVMKTFATQLCDQDMANVAAYYASLKAK
jgi:cytochrome c553